METVLGHQLYDDLIPLIWSNCDITITISHISDGQLFGGARHGRHGASAGLSHHQIHGSETACRSFARQTQIGPIRRSDESHWLKTRKWSIFWYIPTVCINVSTSHFNQYLFVAVSYKVIAWLSLCFILETSWVALYSVVCQCVRDR